MAQVNDPHAQLGELQSDAAPQRDYEREQDEEHKDRDLEPSSLTVGDDEKPSEVDSGSYHEVERNIGVTKIEALYIVFGKGWKLAMLWLYVTSFLVEQNDANDRSILLIYYVFSLGNNTIWNCKSRTEAWKEADGRYTIRYFCLWGPFGSSHHRCYQRDCLWGI
jgi:hypothetical protein